jgi:hypothetical protein
MKIHHRNIKKRAPAWSKKNVLEFLKKSFEFFKKLTEFICHPKTPDATRLCGPFFLHKTGVFRPMRFFPVFLRARPVLLCLRESMKTGLLPEPVLAEAVQDNGFLPPRKQEKSSDGSPSAHPVCSSSFTALVTPLVRLHQFGAKHASEGENHSLNFI